MLSAPSGKAAVISDALPLVSTTVASGVAPLLNVTLPVGTPAVELTVAIKVMFAFALDGLVDETRAVVVTAGVTVRVVVPVAVVKSTASVGVNVTVSTWAPPPSTVAAG